jgi:hypothetical protein
MLGYAGDQEESFLESISSIISTPTLFFISSSELLLAIQLQQAKVDYYMSLKDKKTVYSMVMLETLKFLLKGSLFRLFFHCLLPNSFLRRTFDKSLYSYKIADFL